MTNNLSNQENLLTSYLSLFTMKEKSEKRIKEKTAFAKQIEWEGKYCE